MKKIKLITPDAVAAVIRAHWDDPSKSLSELYRVQSIAEDLADIVAPDTTEQPYARREFINKCIGD